MVTPEFRQIRGNVTSASKYSVIIGRKKYLDFSGAAMAVGYNFIHARDILPPISYLVYHNRYTERLISKLKEMSSFKNVAFSTSGTEACDAALEMNYGNALASFEGSYHGLDFITNAVSNGEGIDFHNRIVHLKFPNSRMDDSTAISINEKILRKASRHFSLERGAIIVELIQSDGGMNVMSSNFADALKDWLNEYSMRLIVDEVYTALGRSGELFLSKKYRFKADYICLGKALGAGLPLGAVLSNKEYPLFRNNLISMQAATMFTAAVALKVLGKVTEERISYVRRMGKYILDVLSEIRNNRILEVRGKGFMIGVELVNHSGVPDPKYALYVREKAARKGVVCTLTGPSNNVLKITPPITIPEGMLEKGISIISDVLREKD